MSLPYVTESNVGPLSDSDETMVIATGGVVSAEVRPRSANSSIILKENQQLVYTKINEKAYIFYDAGFHMKRFLACSGGGDKGIIMVGMLLQLYKIKGKDAVNWDEMAGISVGSFLVGYLSQTTVDTFEPMMLALKTAFIENKIQVIETWSWGGQFINFINAFFNHSSVYSNHRMMQTLHEWFHPDRVVRPFHVGAYNKTLATYETFSSTSDQDMVRAMLASAAVPVILPEVKIGTSMYQDGGMRHLIPVEEIKEWLVRTEGPKHVDVMVCYPIHKINLFMEMSAPILNYPLIDESTRMISDLMLEQLQADIREIATLCGVSYEEIHKTSCGKFTMGDTTIQILSPSSGHFTSMLSMTSEQNKELFASGASTAGEFLKM